VKGREQSEALPGTKGLDRADTNDLVARKQEHESAPEARRMSVRSFGSE
jgi:hypothetical protein